MCRWNETLDFTFNLLHNRMLQYRFIYFESQMITSCPDYWYNLLRIKCTLPFHCINHFYLVLSLNLWVNADTELWKNDILQQLALPDVVETSDCVGKKYKYIWLIFRRSPVEPGQVTSCHKWCFQKLSMKMSGWYLKTGSNHIQLFPSSSPFSTVSYSFDVTYLH